MKKLFFIFILAGVFAAVTSVTRAAQPDGRGFDEFGYNNNARNFVGTCRSWHMGKFNSNTAQAEVYCGVYSDDHLVMKWNAEWDRGNDEGWANPPYNAWTDNQWNGQAAGSGEVWHYKIAWDAGCAAGIAPENAQKGDGYCLWGPFAMLMSQGTIPGAEHQEHIWDVLLKPAGYGAY